NLVAIDPGFDAGNVLTLHVSIPRASASPAAVPSAAAAPAAPPAPVVYDRALLDRLRTVPGVSAAALGTDLPLDGNSSAVFYSAEGQGVTTAQNVPRAYVHRVSPEFFATLRIPLRHGRAFADTDATPASPAVIVSERVVTRFWPGQDPVGKRLK